MRLSFDVKPIGAFIEYTLKPLIDYTHELMDILERHGIVGRDVIQYAFRLYIVDVIARSFTSIICTGLICYTAFLCLHTAK